MRIFPHATHPQGSLEWLQLRSGIPTSSELDSLITPKFEVKTGQGPKSYVAAKVAEAWQGGPLPSFQSFAMEQGSLIEAEVFDWCSFTLDMPIVRVGFIGSDDAKFGGSPDGLLGEHSGIEIKAPAAHTQAAYIINGVLPPEYEHQVHGCLYLTQRPEWKFVSYRRGFPALVLTVERDDEKQAVIAEALGLFHEAFDKAWKKMLEANGGPPPRLKPLTPIPPKPEKKTEPIEITYLQ